MYRDEPLDDELELRALVGDDPVDQLDEPAALETALDVLRLLQGWVTDDQAVTWLAQPARRLDGRSPLGALADGDHDDVVDACEAFIAAQG